MGITNAGLGCINKHLLQKWDKSRNPFYSDYMQKQRPKCYTIQRYIPFFYFILFCFEIVSQVAKAILKLCNWVWPQIPDPFTSACQIQACIITAQSGIVWLDIGGGVALNKHQVNGVSYTALDTYFEHGAKACHRMRQEFTYTRTRS